MYKNTHQDRPFGVIAIDREVDWNLGLQSPESILCLLMTDAFCRVVNHGRVVNHVRLNSKNKKPSSPSILYFRSMSNLVILMGEVLEFAI